MLYRTILLLGLFFLSENHATQSWKFLEEEDPIHVFAAGYGARDGSVKKAA